MAAHGPAPDAPDTRLTTLPNGVRVLTIHQPQVDTAAASLFVRAGSAHESRALNGIGHVVEHMVFKGTATRNCRRINLDAERLGAEVNAHTDKDHMAFHMRGMARDAGAFVRMLSDIVLNATFPADELERERQVLLQEYLEDEDDPMSTAFKLFDKACFGLHPVAQPVIGTRANIERFSRDDLVAHLRRWTTGANLVLGVAGRVDHDAIVREAAAALGALPEGTPNRVAPAPYAGGAVRARPMAGSSQTHLVLGFPLPSQADDDASGMVAAAVLGEGMSSPLLDELRERRGLAYYLACSADVLDMCGQFVIEASLAPDKLEECVTEVAKLVARHARAVDAVDLERAHNQLAVRRLRAQEQPWRRLETAALDLLVLGRPRSDEEWLARLRAVDADAVRGCFQRMCESGVSAALTGKVPRGAGERVHQRLNAALRRG